MKEFYEKLTMKMKSVLKNTEVHKYDSIIKRKVSKTQKIRYLYDFIVSKIFNCLFKGKITAITVFNNSYYLNNIEKYENSYENLCDADSKKKFIDYLIYNLIGSNKFKLPYDYRILNEYLKKVDGFNDINRGKKKFKFFGRLAYFNLKIFNIQLYHNSLGVAIAFFLQQYAYKDIVKVKKDDVVMDCGGGIGDTALYFASRGARKVYVYEFILSNLDIMRQNISLNKTLEHKFEIVPHPVWSSTDAEVSYFDKGPASKVGGPEVYKDKIKTISIDDLANNNNIEKIDFIKMDIEGAELPALRGAEKTIKKHKPKLAICVYHKADDLVKIPKYIKSLNKDYEFYFDYYTDIGWEAVLYAIDKGKKA